MKRIDIAKAFYVDPKQLTIPPGRMRRSITHLSELKASIIEHGQIHPVMVTKHNIVISGARRVTACLELEREVWAVVRDDLDREQMHELELMENVARASLSWDEEAMAVKALHEMYLNKHGKGEGKRKGWSYIKTGEKLGKSGEFVRLECHLVDSIKDLPELLKFTKRSQALSALRNHYETAIEQERAKRAIERRLLAIEKASISIEIATVDEVEKVTVSDIEEIIPGASEMDPEELKQSIRAILDDGVQAQTVPQVKSDDDYLADMNEHLKQGDAWSLMGELKDESINLILADPPYGIDIGDSTASVRIGVYDDSKDWAFEYGKKLLEECYRVLYPNAHMYMFYGMEYYQYYIDWAREVGFEPDIIPMIWVKGKYVGRTGEPLKYPARSYETLLLLHKGELPLAMRGLSNVLVHDPVRGENKIHETEKPVDLYKDLIRRSAYPGFTILDPMAGSASSIEASLDLGYNAIGFESGEDKFAKSLHRLVRWAKVHDTQLQMNFGNGE